MCTSQFVEASRAVNTRLSGMRSISALRSVTLGQLAVVNALPVPAPAVVLS